MEPTKVIPTQPPPTLRTETTTQPSASVSSNEKVIPSVQAVHSSESFFKPERKNLEPTSLHVTKKSVIVLTSDNLIDTRKTRINFSEEGWYDEFLEIREALGKYRGFSEEFINQQVRQ